jgi:hypothetical protein
LLVPAEDAQRPEGVPPAGLTVDLLELEMDLPGMSVSSSRVPSGCFFDRSSSMASKRRLPSGKKRSFAPATRRRVTNPECVPARRWSSFCGRPLSWRAVVLTLEDKIVAEEETMARPRRIRQFDIEAFDDTHEDFGW